MYKVISVLILKSILAAIFSAINGIFVYFLWNWIAPGVFNLAEITFVQSVGICFLFAFLFGRVTFSNKVED